MQTFGKRCHSAKRDPNCSVVIRGWLNKKVTFLHGLVKKMNNFIIACGWVCNLTHILIILQDSSGLKLWKRRWFVLSDYCLFYYKGRNCSLGSLYGFILFWMYNSPLLLFNHVFLSSSDSREESVLGSIPLPSYKILFCTPRECKNRKFTFKVWAALMVHGFMYIWTALCLKCNVWLLA